jgi:hypothetical protein
VVLTPRLTYNGAESMRAVIQLFAVVVLAVACTQPSQEATSEVATQPERIDVSALGPQIGEVVPDFILGDQAGRTWTRDTIMERSGAMLVFVRSAEW